VNQVHQTGSSHNSDTSQHRRHRRDLEEQSRGDLNDEELFGREYGDFLAERDFFDDLDISLNCAVSDMYSNFS
jgi:hypothetical protein